MAGEAVIHMNAEKRPEVTEVKNPKTSIKLTAPKGESFVPGEWYYLVSLPVELTQGFRLTLLSESKTGIYEHSTPVTVERALFGTLTEVDADVAYEVADNRIYPGPRNNEIWYTTTDELPCGPGSPGYEVLSSGESFLSVPDLFGADIVSNTYENGQGVMTFAGPVRFVKGIPDMGSPFYAVSSGGGYNMRLSSIWLQSITLPAGLQTIRDHAFSRCESLPGIQLPDNVTEIGNAAFYYCPALREITLPNKLERIGDQAFSWCSMQSVYIPASVTYIGNSAFSICLELTNIYTTSASVEFGGNPIVNCPVLSSITGPLAGSDQRSIIVDNTLISIASYGLTRYVVPEGITDIGESAFSGMTLSEVMLPATLESIGKKAFSRTSLQSVVIPDGVKSIGADAFDSCPLTEVTIPASVTKLEPTAFERCEQLSRVEILAESVDFHASATNTVGNPFAFCTALAKITGPMVNEDHRTIVVDETLIAVAAAGLTHYDVPDGVVCVAKDAVASSTLEGVTLPSSITEIGNRAFRACSALSSVSLPASLVSVGTIVFPRSLTDLSVLAETPPDIVVRSFDGNYPIYVPAESLEAYRTAPIWKDHYLDRLRSISSEPGGQEGIGYENW